MKLLSTCIIYYSKHHGNTKKLLDAIKAEDPKVELIDVTEKREVDLNGYDRIGFASGIYYTKFAEQVLTFAKVNLPPQKDVFYLATAGNPIKVNFNSIAEVAESKQCNELGRFQCKARLLMTSLSRLRNGKKKKRKRSVIMKS